MACFTSNIVLLRFVIWHVDNINGRYVQRKNVVNNVDKSSLCAPWQNDPYKNTQNITKHGVYKDATDVKKLLFCVLCFFSIFNYLKHFSKTCCITALVRSMKNIGGLTSFSLQQTSHCLKIFWRIKGKNVHSLFLTKPLRN